MSAQTPKLKPATQKSVDELTERCSPLVPQGETVRFALPVRKGIGSHPLMMATWFTQVLIVFQQFRVVAVTDSALYVFKAGWFRRTTPMELLHTLPRDSLLAQKGKLKLGPETVRVERRYWPLVAATTA